MEPRTKFPLEMYLIVLMLLQPVVTRYTHIPPWSELRHPRGLTFWGWFYIFRNRPHVMPGRWGFGICGFEFGSRNPQDPFGVWLKEVGLWPW